ncbi:hypothetical protein L6452_24891 [Arctium lappa]|uniref:Uncharacterized protein n=1 Tax=Arctium lappa TaxID=4217 RepID=A0ACB9ABY4_ARCLA|nr:hypothetical protein L6452_24891 [Arctium lappa]
MEGVDYLSDERKKALFDVEAMKVVWVGSCEALEVSDRIAKLVANGPLEIGNAILSGLSRIAFLILYELAVRYNESRVCDIVLKSDSAWSAPQISVKHRELAGHCTVRELNQRPNIGHAVNVLSPLVEKWKPME